MEPIFQYKYKFDEVLIIIFINLNKLKIKFNKLEIYFIKSLLNDFLI